MHPMPFMRPTTDVRDLESDSKFWPLIFRCCCDIHCCYLKWNANWIMRSNCWKLRVSIHRNQCRFLATSDWLDVSLVQCHLLICNECLIGRERHWILILIFRSPNSSFDEHLFGGNGTPRNVNSSLSSSSSRSSAAPSPALRYFPILFFKKTTPFEFSFLVVGQLMKFHHVVMQM